MSPAQASWSANVVASAERVSELESASPDTPDYELPFPLPRRSTPRRELRLAAPGVAATPASIVLESKLGVAAVVTVRESLAPMYLTPGRDLRELCGRLLLNGRRTLTLPRETAAKHVSREK